MINWISVDERLPDKNGRYLVYIKGRLIKFKTFYEGSFYSQALVFLYDGYQYTPLKKITHWAEINEPENK